MTNAERPEHKIDDLSDEHETGQDHEQGPAYESFADEQESAETGGAEEPRPAAEPEEDNRLQLLETELARTKETMLRALADAENTRKRAVRDREDAGKYAIASFAKDLLGFADNFKRAVDSLPDELKAIDERVASVISGIEAMEKELLQTFEKHGITRIHPEDEMFDPNFHEVMFETPVAGKKSGEIIQVIEPGYVIKDRLLRPARVGVAKGEDQPPQGGDGKPGSTVDTEA